MKTILWGYLYVLVASQTKGSDPSSSVGSRYCLLCNSYASSYRWKIVVLRSRPFQARLIVSTATSKYVFPWIFAERSVSQRADCLEFPNFASSSSISSSIAFVFNKYVKDWKNVFRLAICWKFYFLTSVFRSMKVALAGARIECENTNMTAHSRTALLLKLS